MKTLTVKEMLREKGYTKKEIKIFYKKQHRLSEMNIRYTISHFENDLKKGVI